MMKQAVKGGCSIDRITKDFIPLGKTPVGCKDHDSFFIASGDELEEKMGTMTVNGNIADLIDD
jgi:hypothetical protein